MQAYGIECCSSHHRSTIDEAPILPHLIIYRWLPGRGTMEFCTGARADRSHGDLQPRHQHQSATQSATNGYGCGSNETRHSRDSTDATTDQHRPPTSVPAPSSAQPVVAAQREPKIGTSDRPTAPVQRGHCWLRSSWDPADVNGPGSNATHCCSCSMTLIDPGSAGWIRRLAQRCLDRAGKP
jgi:hypothetical protein